MAAAKYLELAVILKAVDSMSGTVNQVLGKTSGGYQQLYNRQEMASKAMKQGLNLGAGSYVTLDMLNKLTHKYADLREAQQDLRISMMGSGGHIDEGQMLKLMDLAANLSRRFAGSQMDYVDMIRAMKENRLESKDIIGGSAEAIAELSELFKTAPADAAVFAARLKNDMKVPAEEMVKMVDLAARLKQMGIGHGNGAEVISDLTEFYSKAGLGATNLGLHGTKDALELGALGSMFIAKGNDAPSVGTTFRRIFDNIADPAKLKKMDDAAAQYGRRLRFFDNHGAFLGVQNFVAQLTTLQGLSTQKISEILGPVGSKQGMSGDVLKNIAEFGANDYQDFLRRIADQAPLDQKVIELQKGLNQQTKILGTDLDNMEANIGKSYNPALITATKLSQSFINTIADFAGKHQVFSAITAGLLGIAGATMAAGAAYNFAKWALLPYGSMLPKISELFAGASAGAEGFAGSLLSKLLPAVNLSVEGLATIAGAVSVIAGTAFVLYEYFKKVKEGNRMLPDYEKELKNRFDPKDKSKWSDPFKNKKEEADYQAWWLKNAKAGVPYSKLERIDYFNQHPEPVKGAGVMAMIQDWAKTHRSGQPLTGTIKPVTLNYSPTINIHGAADATNVKTLRDTLADHKNQLMDFINSHKHDEHRLAF